MSEVKAAVRFHTWHDNQRDFICSPAKRRVLVSGRRGGKTIGFAEAAVVMALGVDPDDVAAQVRPRPVTPRRVLEVAPTQAQTAAFWAGVKWCLDDAIKRQLVYKNESYRVIELPGGGRIQTKTAWDADTMRGDYADALLYDEYEMMDPSAWNLVGAPMLLDNDGLAGFAGTPFRRNHFFALLAKAKTDQSGRYAFWHFTSFANPYLNRVALAEIIQDMSEDAYNQEILAQFLENEGTVFRNLDKALKSPSSSPADHAGHLLVMGVDWGKSNDYTVLSVGCVDCQREVALQRFNKIGWKYQRGRLADLATAWGTEWILAEHNSIGSPNIEALVDEGLPVEPFDTTATSKPPLIENLALALERAGTADGILLLDDPIAKAELEAFEMSVSLRTGRPTYGAPEGLHDDTVIARALMARAIFSYMPAIL